MTTRCMPHLIKQVALVIWLHELVVELSAALDIVRILFLATKNEEGDLVNLRYSGQGDKTHV